VVRKGLVSKFVRITVVAELLSLPVTVVAELLSLSSYCVGNCPQSHAHKVRGLHDRSQDIALWWMDSSCRTVSLPLFVAGWTGSFGGVFNGFAASTKIR
jgi:hypothetical protein